MAIAEWACQVIGVIGFVLYMLSYFQLQIGRIEGSGSIYTLMNLSAASFVLISLIHNFNLASMLIQVSWILISFIGLIRIRGTEPVEINRTGSNAQS